jgi:uncharacterized protein (TIGR03435 family)
MIRQAYLTFADGRQNPLAGTVPIQGGPDWISSFSDRYEVNAKAEGTPTQEMMGGPMLQALLEDRFKLRIRRETRAVPVYVMTVAKGGLKLKEVEEGSCDPMDLTRPERPAFSSPDGLTEILQPGEKTTCGRGVHSSLGPDDLTMTVHGLAMTLAEFSNLIAFDVGRRVIDQTGAGAFLISASGSQLISPGVH